MAVVFGLHKRKAKTIFGGKHLQPPTRRLINAAWIAVFALPVPSSLLSHPQDIPPKEVPAQTASYDAKTVNPPGTPALAGSGSSAGATVSETSRVTEGELRQRLTGHLLYLRGLWLNDELHFDLHGDLAGESSKGSFTLCAVQIERVHMTKRHVELEGARYGIHFLDDARWADRATTYDRIRITPKKKRLVITIERQLVVPEGKNGTANQGMVAAGVVNSAAGGSAAPAAVVPVPAAGGESDAVTTSATEAASHLREALNKIFAPSLDASMIAGMPDYWQYFYQAQLSHQWIEPTDPDLVRPGPGVQAPAVIGNVAPRSNDYAQSSGVAGAASYKVIVGPDGKPTAVAIYRPIGFGLDENAVAAIRKSTFAPAMKDGKPASSVIDVSVNFRIYSKRTAEAVASAHAEPAEKPLPGLYSVAGRQNAGAGAAASGHP